MAKKGALALPLVYNRAMPFSEEIIRTVWARAGGICECRGDRHGHGERCGQSLLWSLRGSDSTAGGWSTVRRTTWGTDILADCEIRCAPCQKPVFVRI